MDADVGEHHPTVTPAQAGAHGRARSHAAEPVPRWTPACAGVTDVSCNRGHKIYLDDMKSFEKELGMFGFNNQGDRHCGPRGPGRPSDVTRWEAWADEFMRSALEGGKRGGRRRMFDGGELRLVLLKMIADEPRHGYDLIRRIEELTGGAYAPSPGVVYPTLTLLDEMGLIAEQQSEGAKKRFAATDEGRAHLAARAEEVAALIARLTALGEHRNRADKTPVRRAMANLRHAVNDRLVYGGDLSDDAAHQIAAAIDEAVQKIERLK